MNNVIKTNLKDEQFYPITGEYGALKQKHLKVGTVVEAIETSKYRIVSVGENGNFEVKSI